MTLEEMRSVDPRTVDRETLVERGSVHVDKKPHDRSAAASLSSR